MKRHEGNLNAYYSMEKANKKGYILYDSNILEQEKLGRQLKDQCFSRVGAGDDYVEHKGFLGQSIL